MIELDFVISLKASQAKEEKILDLRDKLKQTSGEFVPYIQG